MKTFQQYILGNEDLEGILRFLNQMRQSYKSFMMIFIAKGCFKILIHQKQTHIHTHITYHGYILLIILSGLFTILYMFIM